MGFLIDIDCMDSSNKSFVCAVTVTVTVTATRPHSQGLSTALFGSGFRSFAPSKYPLLDL